jgi:hypothetical protein
MFCVVTAPIPARAWAQRAATAGDDDATATANWPVRAQRAAMENVMSLLLPAHQTTDRFFRKTFDSFSRHRQN